jgi:hypothetical protein
LKTLPRLSQLHPFLFLLFVVLFAVPSYAQAPTVTPDSTASVTISSSAGSTTGSTNLNLAIGSDTNVMGFKFDLVFSRAKFSFDSTSAAAGALLTTNASGNETYVLIVDQDSANASPRATVTVIGVRMQSSASNKGLNNATYNLLSGLRFIKLTADTTYAASDSIIVTNFVFRDAFNETVATSRAQIQLSLFLLLLRRGADFNGDNVVNAFDQLDFLKVLNGIMPLGALPDYGATIGDVGAAYESRTSNSIIDGVDQLIFLRFLNGVES